MNFLKPLMVVIFSGLLAAAAAWVIAIKILPAESSSLAKKVTMQNQSTTPTPTPTPLELSADKLYSLINAYRKENNLSPLRANVALEKSAAAKNADMVENQYWRHQDVEGLESWYLVKQAGYNYQKVGENLAFAAQSEWQVFQDWVESQTHNAQLLDENYQDMGVAFDCQSYSKYAKGGCLITLHLAQPGLQ